VEEKIKIYKRKFDAELRHVKVILLSNKSTMEHHEWIRLVLSVKRSIKANPKDFFCIELPIPEIAMQAIDRVFDGFFEDQRIRKLQQGKEYPY
jgi:hypothetical protein